MKALKCKLKVIKMSGCGMVLEIWGVIGTLVLLCRGGGQEGECFLGMLRHLCGFGSGSPLMEQPRQER